MSRSSHAAWLAPAAMMALLAVGCGRPPATHYYVLEITPAEAVRALPASRRSLDVGVQAFQVDPPYDQDRIVYRVRSRSSEVGFYEYHRWAFPLSRMISAAVAEGLQGLPRLGTIEPAVAGRDYDAWLAGRVLEIEEIDHAGGQDVLLRLELSLRDDDGQELWSGVYSARDTLRTTEVADVVELMNDALERAIADAREPFAQAVADTLAD